MTTGTTIWREYLRHWRFSMAKKNGEDKLKYDTYADKIRETIAGGGPHAQEAAIEVGLEQTVKFLDRRDVRESEAKAAAEAANEADKAADEYAEYAAQIVAEETA